MEEKYWKPKNGDVCYCPKLDLENGGYVPRSFVWNGGHLDLILYNKGIVFKTEEECYKYLCIFKNK